ncbi:hypothetical protein BB560_004192, partial [Smittium megazygosporum]
NLFGLNGQLCPVTPILNYTCPQLCVSDTSLCPSQVRPACGPGLTYCVDQTCRPSCPNDLVNPCLCKSSGSLKLSSSVSKMVPCLPLPNVDIYDYDPSSKKTVSRVCSNSLNLTQVDFWSAKTSEQTVWLSCPVKTPSFNLKSKFFISIWTILATQCSLLLFWIFYKSFHENSSKSYYMHRKSIEQDHDINGLEKAPNSAITALSSEKLASSPKSSDDSIDFIDSKSKINILEYKNSLFGSLVKYLLFVSTISWFVFILLIILDYYNLLTAEGASLASGDYTLLAKLFIALWCSLTALILILSLVRHKIENFFRILTHLGSGNTVEISQTEEVIQFASQRPNILTRALGSLEHSVKNGLGLDKKYTNCKIQNSSQNRRFFEFHSTRYVYNDSLRSYSFVAIDIGKSGPEIFGFADGLSQKEAEIRSEVLGPNFIQIQISSVLKFSSFFYIYQFMILLLFYYYSYYQVGIADTVVILISASIKVIINLKSERRLKKLTEYSGKCIVLRDGKLKEENTMNLVVGDVVAVERGQVLTFDGVVISGEVIVDESSLTGEAMPVRKLPLNQHTNNYDPNTTGKINSLFAGARVFQSIPEPNKESTISSNTANDTNSTLYSLAVVSKIGIHTERGKIISKILYPTKFVFIFTRQIRVVMAILFLQGMLWLSLSVWFLKASSVASFFSGMFSLSQLISPLLPASLVVGQSIAVQRLKKHKIFCVEMPRVMIAGKVQIFCFDKTGTLTKDGLEFDGVCEPIVSPSSTPAQNLITNEENSVPNKPEIQGEINKEAKGSSLVLLGTKKDKNGFSYNSFVGIGCCNSVTKIEDQFIGNPVDVEMFRNSGWKIVETRKNFLQTITPDIEYTGLDQTNSSQCNTIGINILKRNEFSHTRASMSTVIYDELRNEYRAFCKGSFERISHICKPSTIPVNYMDFAKVLSSEGCYVMALGTKKIEATDTSKIINFSVDEIESDLEFSCLLIFKNNLKPDTSEALSQIKQGNVRCVMITGDTAQTGIYIAKKSGMIPEGKDVALGDIDENGLVVFKNVNTGRALDINSEIISSGNSTEKYFAKTELAVTGLAFEKMVANGTIRSLIQHIRVFGRMTPRHKVMCINYQMEIGVTAMCGDGGNDSGALKTAHVGLALSGAEASIVSPFSTSSKSLMTCVQLLTSCRGALATSFANYKHLILYGQTMALFKIMTMYFSISVSQPLWIIIDAFITVGISLAVSLSKSAKYLASKRPTAKILGPQTLASSIGQVILNWIFMISAFLWLFRQPWYRCHEFDSSKSNLAQWWLLGDNYEGEVAGFIVLYQFVNVGFIYNFGYLFRERWYKNYLLISLWGLFIILASYIQLADPNRLGCYLRMNCGDPDVLVQLGYKRPNFSIEPYNIPIGHNVLARKDRFILWSFSIANMAIGILWELVVVIGPVGRYISNSLSRKKKIVS